MADFKIDQIKKTYYALYEHIVRLCTVLWINYNTVINCKACNMSS